MAVIRVTDDTTRAELAEAITNLRARQQAATLDVTKAEVQVRIDALLERYEGAPA
jgi:hypothetical protein